MASSSSNKWVGKDAWKKKKELDEARKAGTVEAEKDESGKDINPHIPLYISRAPWYLNKDIPTLSHQRPQKSEEQSSLGLKEGIKKGAKNNVATKYRKGACENCGAMTHQKKDCVERPRKKGAKLTNSEIMPDEYIPPVETTYDGKRDRWNNYDPNDHLRLVEEHENLEKLREKRVAEKDEYKADESEGHVQKLDTKTRTTVRHLRIREDTAKYLYNLDPNSAYYDPKTRSMRDNPNPHINPDDQLYSGDNFTRISGDARKFNEFRAFAWDAYEKGADIHNVAAPSSAELLFKQSKHTGAEKSAQRSHAVLQKYGGSEHLLQPPKELIFGQQEVYEEYSRDGRLLKGPEKAVPKSKYEEDVLVNNHKSVWGSYWREGQWGYACCHQHIRNSYCTGESGKMAMQGALEQTFKKNVPSERQEGDKGEDKKEDKWSDESESEEKVKKEKKKEKKKRTGSCRGI